MPLGGACMLELRFKYGVCQKYIFLHEVPEAIYDFTVTGWNLIKYHTFLKMII